MILTFLSGFSQCKFFHVRVHFKKLTCLPCGLTCQRQFQGPNPIDSIYLCPSRDLTKRLPSKKKKTTSSKVFITFIKIHSYSSYLCCSTFVPRTVIENMLPLLKNENKIKIICLMNSICKSGASCIKDEVMFCFHQIFSRKHSISQKNCQMA